MRTLKDILIVILLLVLVTMTCFQEADILKLKRRVFVLRGGLMQIIEWVAQIEATSSVVEGGLAPAEGGLGLQHFRACSASLWVTVKKEGPITLFPQLTRGTGVFVSDNVLLTAKHVIEKRTNDRSVLMVGPDGKRYVSVSVLEDFDDDLAIVILRDRQGPWMELGPSPSLGDNVICIGTPLNDYQQLIITWGRVSSEKYKNLFVYDGFAWPGCSGGPVIVGGKVVGITESRLNRTASLGFAVPIITRLDPVLMTWIR